MFRFLVVASCLALTFGLPSKVVLPRLDGRIVGGEPAQIEDLPYQISLQSYGSHICGGSILDKNRVVTAAHCTDGSSASSLSIRAGSSIRGSGGQVLDVAEIHQNPGFDFGKLDYDVSVLVLDGDLNLGSGVQPIDLTSSEPSGGEDAICSGWGTLSSGGSLPSQLQQVEVQVVDKSTCRDAYGSSAITDRMICAGARGKDSCQGDSGGPLAVNGKLAGIVSWGYGCADPDYPGVYSNVDALRDYIDSN